MFDFAGIDHIQLAAPRECEDEARAFYGTVLRMQEIPKPEALQKRGGVWFQCGIHQVHIGVQDDFVPATKAHPAFHVRNLETLRLHLVEHGVPVKDDDALPGFERFYISDPFGNRIELLEPTGELTD